MTHLRHFPHLSTRATIVRFIDKCLSNTVAYQMPLN